MPIIRLDYDNEKLDDGQVLLLSNAIQKIVSDVTQIEDVFVYGNTPRIKVRIAPVEIFIEMSSRKIKDEGVLLTEIKTRLSQWKKENNIQYPMNLTLIPMNWKIEIGI